MLDKWDPTFSTENKFEEQGVSLSWILAPAVFMIIPEARGNFMAISEEWVLVRAIVTRQNHLLCIR